MIEGGMIGPMMEEAAVTVEVVYVEDAPAAEAGTGRFSAVLPTPDVPSTYVAWTVFVPQEAKVKQPEGEANFRTEHYH